MTALEEFDEKKSNPTTFEFSLCCDSVEWCHYKELSSTISVGHYELTNDQKKIGGISLLEYQSNEDKNNNLNYSFNKLLFKQTPPILDLKWHSISSNNIYLTAATSIGTIELYSNKLELKQQIKIPNIENENEQKSPICLSLDWNKIINKSNLCCTSLSDGSICVLEFDNNKYNIERIKGHSDQVWTNCFDIDNDKILYSGSDDCLFGVWDYKNKILINGDKYTHTMGICSINNYLFKNNKYLLLTGSYDEILRIWDKRNWKKPINELKFNDGVWRIKSNKNNILIATMRDHFNIVTFDENKQILKKIYSYNGHYDKYKSNKNGKNDKGNHEEDIDILCYGCDWSPNDKFVVSCSFYDKQVHFWKH